MNFDAAVLAEVGRWLNGVVMFTLEEAVEEGNVHISAVADIRQDSPLLKGYSGLQMLLFGRRRFISRN